MKEDFDYIRDQAERLAGRIARSKGLRFEKDGGAYTAGMRLYHRRSKRKFVSVTIQDNEFLGDVEYKVSTIGPGKTRTEKHYNFHNFQRELEDQVNCLVSVRKMATSVILRVAHSNLRLKRQEQLLRG